MDRERFEEIVRSLTTAPSRRAVGRALAGLTAGSLLAAHFDQAVEGKKGHHKDKHKKHKPKECPSGQSKCRKDGKCCQEQRCSTGCGCCPETTPNCCSGNRNTLCFDPNKGQCCTYGPSDLVGVCAKGTYCTNLFTGLPWCCPTGYEQCPTGCCAPGLHCCGGVCCVDPDGCTKGEDCEPIVLGSPAKLR